MGTEHRIDRLEQAAAYSPFSAEETRARAMSDQQLVDAWWRAQPPVDVYCEGCRKVTRRPPGGARCPICHDVPIRRARVRYWEEQLARRDVYAAQAMADVQLHLDGARRELALAEAEEQLAVRAERVDLTKLEAMSVEDRAEALRSMDDDLLLALRSRILSMRGAR